MTVDRAEGRPSGSEPVEGPAFGWTSRILASVLVLALAMASRSVWTGALAQFDASIQLGLGLGASLVVLGYINILSSRTGIASGLIYQTGLLGKRVPLHSITQVRIVHVPGLEWLIVPRLVVRSGAFRSQSFPAADARVLQAFKRLAYGHPVEQAEPLP